MIRYTTPTHKFLLPSSISVGTITNLKITYSQKRRNQPVLTKVLSDATITSSDNSISVSLSETETAMFTSNYGSVLVQLRIGVGSTRMASKIMMLELEDVLDDHTLTAPV